MPKKTGTATEHVLTTLRRYADREMQVADLFNLADGKFTKENLNNALARNLEKGLVTRTTESDRSSWWAISQAGLDGGESSAGG